MALEQFVGITDKSNFAKPSAEQTFDETSKETPAENASNTLREHRAEQPNPGKLGAKNTLGK